MDDAVPPRDEWPAGDRLGGAHPDAVGKVLLVLALDVAVAALAVGDTEGAGTVRAVAALVLVVLLAWAGRCFTAPRRRRARPVDRAPRRGRVALQAGAVLLTVVAALWWAMLYRYSRESAGYAPEFLSAAFLRAFGVLLVALCVLAIGAAQRSRPVAAVLAALFLWLACLVAVLGWRGGATGDPLGLWVAIALAGIGAGFGWVCKITPDRPSPRR